MTLPEYVQLGLYDPSFREEERRRYITNTLHWPITHQCCDMTWQATTEDTWLNTRLRERSGISVPRTMAIVDRSVRCYPGTRTIRTAAQLRDFALTQSRHGACVFAKENRGIVGFGVFLIREAESDRLHLEGEGWLSYEDCFARLIADTTYLLQPVVRNHSFFERYTKHLGQRGMGRLSRLADGGSEVPNGVIEITR